jgi:(p)ppGpp synthase/HD superfamily hydrolase
MNITPRIQKAIDRVTELHAQQLRKDNKTPYVEHLLAVAEILSGYTDDEDIIIAGLYHDTIEDVPGYTYDNLVEEQGKRVADIVEGVTQLKPRDDPRYHKDLPWDEKVAIYEEYIDSYIKKTEKAGIEAMLVKAADSLHNLRTLITTFKREGEKFLKNFRQPFPQKFQYYHDVLAMTKRHFNNGIEKELEETYEQARTLLKEYL